MLTTIVENLDDTGGLEKLVGWAKYANELLETFIRIRRA